MKLTLNRLVVKFFELTEPYTLSILYEHAKRIIVLAKWVMSLLSDHFYIRSRLLKFSIQASVQFAFDATPDGTECEHGAAKNSQHDVRNDLRLQWVLAVVSALSALLNALETVVANDFVVAFQCVVEALCFVARTLLQRHSAVMEHRFGLENGFAVGAVLQCWSILMVRLDTSSFDTSSYEHLWCQTIRLSRTIQSSLKEDLY